MRAAVSLKICTLMQYFCQQHINIQLKIAEELCIMTLNCDPNFQEKPTFSLKNDMRILMNFNSSSGKSENLNFHGIFLSKVCNV